MNAYAKKKCRPAKPFALLYPSIDLVKEHFQISSFEENALNSTLAPIVILSSEKEIPGLEAESIAPNLVQMGVMLPSSALLQLLMNKLN